MSILNKTTTKLISVLILTATIPLTVLSAPAATPTITGATNTQPTASPIFTDVADTNPHYFAISQIKNDGFIKGYPDGTFKPDATVTRAEALAILLKAAGITAEKSVVKLPFSDVKDDSWFYSSIQKAFALKKAKGFEDGTFKPLNPVTLPEAFALAFSFLNIDTSKTIVEGTIYQGLDSKAWYAKNLQYAKNTFILSPTLLSSSTTGIFSADYKITRAELAEIIFRTRQVKTKGGALDITTSWTTTDNKENFWQLKFPSSWTVFKGSANSVLWNKKNYQAFFTRMWPTGVRLSLSVVENPDNVGAQTYFETIKNSYNSEYGTGKSVFIPTTIAGRSALKVAVAENRILDTYLSLPNKKFLVMYGEYGSAPIGEYLKKELELVVASYVYVEAPKVEPKPLPPLDERIQTLRSKIVENGGWGEVKDMFPDKKLISTDGIGIGTGPVDYYFTAEANTTAKIERRSSTILNIKDGNSSAF